MESMPDDPDQFDDEWAVRALQQVRASDRFGGSSRFAGDGLQHMLMEKVWKNCFRWSGESLGVLGNTTRLMRAVFTARDRDRTGRLSPIYFEACLKAIPGTSELSSAHLSKLRESYRVYDEYDREKMFCDYERFIHDMAFGRLVRSEQLAHAAGDLRQCIRDKMGRATNLSRDHEATKLGKRLTEIIEGPTKSVATKGDDGVVPPLTGLVARRAIEQNCGIMMQEHTMFHIGADYVEKENRNWAMSDPINREILMDFIDDYALDLLDPTWNEGLVTDIVLREWSGKEERELDEEGYTVVPVDFSRFAMASKPGGHVGMKKPVFMFVQRKSRSDITLDPRAIVTDIALIANPTADEWKQFSAEGGQGWWPKDDFHGIFLFLKRGAVPTGGTNAPTAVSDIVIVIEDRDGMMSQTGAEASVRPSGMHHPAKRFDIPCCRLWLLQPHQRVAFDPIVAGTGGAAASGAIVPAGDAGRVVTSAALQHAVEMIRKNKDIANDLKHPSRWTRVVDTNRDGRVSHEELSRAFEFEYEIPMKALSYEEKKALFSAIDADTNGSVTMAEMTKFLSSYKMPSVRYEFQDAPHGHSSGASSSAGQRFLTLGAEVQAHYRSDGVWHDQFYPGIVSRISPDGTCDIKYDDGDSAKGVPPSRVRFRDGSAPSTGNPSSAGGMPHGGAQGAARRKAGVLRVRILSAAGLEGDDRYSWGIAASAAWQNPYGLLKIVHTRGGEHDAKFVKTSPAIRTAANGERGGTADWDAHKTYNRVTRLRVWEGGSDPMLHVQLRRSPVTEGRPAEEIGSGVVSLSDVLTATGSSAKRTVELNHGRGTVTLELSFVALAVPNSRDPSAPATKTPNEELKADDDCGGTLYASIIGLKGLSPTMLADGMHSSRPFIEFKLPWARTSGERATAKTLPLEPSQALIAGSGGAGAAAKFQHSRLELQVMEGRNLPSRADGGRPTAFIQMFVMDAEQHRAFLAGMPTESDAMYVDTMAGPKSSRTGPSDAKWFTEQIRSTSNPQWNEEFIFPSNKTDFVVLVVRDMLEPRNAMDHVSQAPIAYADVCISEFLNASSGSGDRTSQPRWLSLKPFVGGNPPPLSAKLQVELVVADTLQYESGSYQSQQLVRFESTDVLEGIRQAINRMAKSAGSKQASGGGLGLAVSLMHKTSWGEPSVLAVGTLEFTPTASAASAVPRSSSSGDKRTYSAWATLRLPSRASGGASASGEVACQALVELRFEPAHAQSSNVERIKVGIDLVDAKNIAYADASRSAAPPNPYVVGVRATGEEVFRSETKTATTNVSFNEFLGHFEVTSPQDTLEMKLMHAPRGHAGSWFSQSQSIPDALIGAAPISIGKKSWTAREGDVETLELMMEPSRDQQMLQGSLRSAGSIRVKLSVLEVHRAAGGLSAGSAASIIDPFANSPPSPYLATQSPQMRLQAVMHVKEMVLAAQSRGQSAQRMFAEKDPGNTGMVGLDVFRHVLATLLHAGAMQTGGMRGGSTFEGFHAEMQLVEEECRLATGKIDHRRFTAMLSSSNVQQLLRAPGTKRPPGPYSDSGTVGFSRGDTYSASLPIFDVERGAHSRALTLQPSYGSSSRANPQDLGGNGIDWLQAPRVLPRLWNDFERSDRDGLGHAPLETFLRVLRSVSSSLGDRGEIPEHLLQALARQFSPVSVDAASRHGRDCVNYEGLCTAIENGSALTSTRAPGATYASGVFNGMVRDAMEKSRKWAMRSFSGKDELKATLLVNGTRFGDTFAGGNSASSAFITRVIPRALFRRRLSSLGLVLDSSEWVSLLNAFNADGAGAVGVNVDSFISALKLDGAFVAEGGGWQSSKLVGAPGAAVSGVRALRWRVLESIFMRGAYGLDKAKDLLMHEDADGRNKGDMLQNDGIIGRSSFRRAIRRIVQGRVSRDVRTAPLRFDLGASRARHPETHPCPPPPPFSIF